MSGGDAEMTGESPRRSSQTTTQVHRMLFHNLAKESITYGSDHHSHHCRNPFCHFCFHHCDSPQEDGFKTQTRALDPAGCLEIYSSLPRGTCPGPAPDAPGCAADPRLSLPQQERSLIMRASARQRGSHLPR